MPFTWTRYLCFWLSGQLDPSIQCMLSSPILTYFCLIQRYQSYLWQISLDHSCTLSHLCMIHNGRQEVTYLKGLDVWRRFCPICNGINLHITFLNLDQLDYILLKSKGSMYPSLIHALYYTIKYHHNKFVDRNYILHHWELLILFWMYNQRNLCHFRTFNSSHKKTILANNNPASLFDQIWISNPFSILCM